MTYKATTSIPENRERVQKSLTFDSAGGSNVNVWIPSDGYRISLNDICISLINKQANTYIAIVVQVWGGGQWNNVVGVAAGNLSAANFAHNYGNRIRSQVGDGTNARMRLVKQGNSTSWESIVVITGEEV